jgi:hypothetical protein
MSERDERFRESLRGLAQSAVGEPPLNGPELRRLAERRHRRGLLAVPTLALSGLLVGGTALAVSGAFGPEPRPAAPASSGTPSGSAPGTMPTQSALVRPPAPHASAAPSTASNSAAPTAPGRTVPTGSSASGPAVPQVPGTTVVCAVPRTGETLVRLDALQLPTGLTPDVDALLYAVPLSCVHGQLQPAGPAQWLQVAPDAAVTTTAPLSTGPHPAVSTLAALATGLTQHPEQLFGIDRDAEGRVSRLDQVFQGSPSSTPTARG